MLTKVLQIPSRPCMRSTHHCPPTTGLLHSCPSLPPQLRDRVLEGPVALPSVIPVGFRLQVAGPRLQGVRSYGRTTSFTLWAWGGGGGVRLFLQKSVKGFGLKDFLRLQTLGIRRCFMPKATLKKITDPPPCLNKRLAVSLFCGLGFRLSQGP